MTETATPRVSRMSSSRVGRSSGAAGEEFVFASGSLCLDLVATIEDMDDRRTDTLATPGRLAEWLLAAGMPRPAGGVTGDDLLRAHVLRRAIHALAVALIADAHPDSPAVQVINRAAAQPTPVFLLDSSGTREIALPAPDVTGVLSVIARDAVHLFAGDERRRVSECERDGCTRLFCDRSPNGRRRWCAMKGCGEIVASAAYRKRHSEKK